MGAADLVAQIAGQHAPGREHRGDRRHDDAPDLELACDLGGVHAGGAAKTQEREFSRIDAATQRHQADAVGHLQIDHLVDAGGGLEPRQIQRCRDPIDRGLGCRAIQRPGAMLAMSRLRSAMRWPASMPSAESEAWPSDISEMSVEVPPMSNGTRSGIPSISAQRRLPEMPPAGPDSTVPAASREASSTGAMPPCDNTTNSEPLNPASCRLRSRLVR